MQIAAFFVLIGCTSICFGQISQSRPAPKESKMPVVNLATQDVLQLMAQAVANKITENPQDLPKLFHEAFLNKVSSEKLAGILKQFYVEYGKVVSIALISQISPTSGKFTFKFQKNASSKVTLAITADPIPKVIGLFFEAPVGEHQTIAEIIAEMVKLPGSVSFMVAKLDPEIRNAIF